MRGFYVTVYTSQAGEERRINHFHYVDWPDFNVPKVVSQQNILGHIFLVLVTIIMIVIKTSIIAILNPLYSVTRQFPGILALRSSPSNIQSIFSSNVQFFLNFQKINVLSHPTVSWNSCWPFEPLGPSQKLPALR